MELLYLQEKMKLTFEIKFVKTSENYECHITAWEGHNAHLYSLIMTEKQVSEAIKDGLEQFVIEMIEKQKG